LAGRVGTGVATFGRAIDPLSAAVSAVTEGIPAAYRAAEQRMPGAVQGNGQIVHGTSANCDEMNLHL
jgi:hypothetical protein